MASRKIDKIIIHCSASPNGRPTTAADIDSWHKLRGFKRTSPTINPKLAAIGYHFVVCVDGTVQTGRGIEEAGAHANSFNANSIGICLVGTDCFSRQQWLALSESVHLLMKAYPSAQLIGHRDLPNVHKLCPGFDVSTWFHNGMGILEAQCLADKTDAPDVPVPAGPLVNNRHGVMP